MPGIGGSIERVTDQDRLTGVRGWLLLPPVVVGLNILGLAIEITRLAILGSEGGAGIWVAAFMVSALFIPLGTLAIIRLLQERKSARRLMIIFFGSLLALYGLGAFTPPSSENPFEVLAIYRTILISAAIIVYFLVSRRVKLTLVN